MLVRIIRLLRCYRGASPIARSLVILRLPSFLPPARVLRSVMYGFGMAAATFIYKSAFSTWKKGGLPKKIVLERANSLNLNTQCGGG